MPRLSNLDLDWNDTVPRMLKATHVLFPSEDFFSSRLTWHFYSGHHCDYTERSRTFFLFSFVWDIPSIKSISLRFLFCIIIFIMTNTARVVMAECYCLGTWYLKKTFKLFFPLLVKSIMEFSIERRRLFWSMFPLPKKKKRHLHKELISRFWCPPLILVPFKPSAVTKQNFLLKIRSLLLWIGGPKFLRVINTDSSKFWQMASKEAFKSQTLILNSQ